jgi:hypothetical protein
MTRSAKYVMFIGSAILLVAICFYPQVSLANPPQEVTLEYDVNSQTLAVSITHKSISPGFHYIKTVEIKKDGKVMSANTYDNQPAPETFTYKYMVPAAEGETIEVTAACNMYGSKTVNLMIPKKSQ